MANKATEITLEKLKRIVGDKSFEIVLRQKNGRIKSLTKYVLENSNKDTKDTIKNLMNSLSGSTTKHGNFTANIASQLNISNAISSLNLAVGALNLCATVAGFVIIFEKLEGMKNDIDNLLITAQKIHDQETFYKYSKVLGDYHHMLKRKEDKREMSEDEYYDLLNEEQAVLELLVSNFSEATSNSKNNVLHAIIALSSMFACTMSNYDEVYYFGKKDIHRFDDPLFSKRVYENLLSKSFLNDLYDFMFLDENRNQYESDILVDMIRDGFTESRQFIEDRRSLIKLNNTNEEYSNMLGLINQSVLDDVDESIEEMGLSNNVQIQSLVKEATQTLGMS